MTDIAAYAGLFIAALVAATILPMQSEAVLIGLLLAGYEPWLLVAVASIGNVLGSLINWFLGRGAGLFLAWLPAKDLKLERAQLWYHRYGRWSLLLSWAPIIGDALTVVAGILREPLPTFLLLVTIAKVSRYVVIALTTSSMN